MRHAWKIACGSERERERECVSYGKQKKVEKQRPKENNLRKYTKGHKLFLIIFHIKK